MSREHILVVEDEEDIIELITYNLQREGYTVTRAESGEQALQQVRAQPAADVILLDLMLPRLSGIEVCRRLKADEQTKSIPIIMVTARGEEADIVTGLDAGADDYITKPFRPRELVARVRALLRRASRTAPASGAALVKIHDIEIDSNRRTVLARGKPVTLTYTEFEVLHFLASRPGWVFTRYQIVDAVRGENYPVTDRSVDVQVVGLRRKLGKGARHIETVRGIGYRFRDADS